MTIAIADQPHILSLCTGYGGLTRAVETVTGYDCTECRAERTGSCYR